MYRSLLMNNTCVKHKLLLIILLLPGVRTFAGNPFISMIGKPYAEYIMELQHIYYILDHVEQEKADSLMLYIEEAAEVANNRNWKVEAESFFLKITDDPDVNCYSLLQLAYSTLGLIYRYHYDDLEKSDMYFRRMLDVPYHSNSSEIHCLSWEGIANGNLGNNLYLRKQYKEAIPLLEFACRTMSEINDYTYATGAAALLANIYLEQKDLDKCKHYIDVAIEYIQNSYPVQRWGRVYPVMAKYYAVTGNSELAAAYQDSAAIYQRLELEEYDALKILYANLRINKLEHKAKDDKLRAEHERAESYKRLAICITAGLLVIAGVLFYAIILYHRKRMAYRVLVKKSQEWAAAKKFPLNESFKPIEPEMNYEPVEQTESILLSETETALMQRIRRLMDEERVYIDPNFTLADIAARLEVNRTYISATINRCEGKTLTNLMNEYRIMLAIDVMSSPENATLTIDAIADFSGFNDRKTFYRIFKKTTGLAPSEFRANVTMNE